MGVKLRQVKSEGIPLPVNVDVCMVCPGILGVGGGGGCVGRTGQPHDLLDQRALLREQTQWPLACCVNALSSLPHPQKVQQLK
jgi:hypothetical protein